MNFLEDTKTEATANVSGPIVDNVPAAVVGIVFFKDDNDFISWAKDDPEHVNTLVDLEAGKLYSVIVDADVDVPAFSDASNDSRALNKKYIFRGETTDTSAGSLPAIPLENSSLSLLKVLVCGKTDDNSYLTTMDIGLSVSVDDAGAVTVEGTDIFIHLNADSNFTVDTGTANKFIPQVTNITSAFIGTTRWAVTIEVSTIVYSPAL